MSDETKTATELQPGDRFRHKGVLYEVEAPALRGRYGLWNIPCRPVRVTVVNVDRGEALVIVPGGAL